MPVSIISRIPSRTSSVSITQLLCLDPSGAVFDVAIVFVISLKDNSNLHKYGPKLYPHVSPRDLRSPHVSCRKVLFSVGHVQQWEGQGCLGIHTCSRLIQV